METGVEPCARLVERADPERFRAIMAAPPAAREVLFPIFAANVEISRAPWMTSDPALAAIRLQWWRDALAEIEAHATSGGLVRRHEVVLPLAQVLFSEGVALLDRVAVARHQDLEPRPFEDDAALWSYLEETTGCLMAAAGVSIGDVETEAMIRAGAAAGLANYLRAVPQLVAMGRHPLPDGRDAALADLAREGLARWQADADALPMSVRLTGWLTPLVLKRVVHDPSAVGAGRLEPGPFRQSLALGRMAMFG